jgi:phosphoribosylglycinamide formyltransferase 1
MMSEPPVLTRLGVLLSGGGSNFKAIMDAIVSGELDNATVVCVGSNKARAGGLDIARNRGVETFSLKPSLYTSLESYDQDVLDRFSEAGVEAIVLAGYLRRISPVLLEAYPNRIINIHPSLLPKYGGAGMYGAYVHQAVLASGDAVSGCTVHVVTAGVDEGPILAQVQVPVLPSDTPDTLAARVLQEEHRLYAPTIKRWLLNDEATNPKNRVN